jgi:hypothetical protein
MPTNKYELVLDNEVIASGMDVNTALIFIGALYEKYYNEEGMSITIREMDRAKANESNNCKSDYANLIGNALLTALDHCSLEDCEGCPLNGADISEDCIIHLLRTSHRVLKDFLGK